MIGKRFHFLVAQAKVGSDRYECLCDCGNVVVAYTGNLNKGKTKSCGCWKKMTIRLINASHGMAYSDEYKIWQGLRTRCKNERSTSFPLYGGRGIRVCERWDSSFEFFYEDMGARPSKLHSIDRIDSSGDYEPSNCRWATPIDQSSNTSRNVYVALYGELLTTSEFARRTGFSKGTVYRWVTRDKLTREQIEERLVARKKSALNESARRAGCDIHPSNNDVAATRRS